MRLSYIKFRTIEKFGNASTTELINDDFGELQFKPDEQTVHVGPDIFPMSAVCRMRGVEKDEICPECGVGFKDVSGLSGHRRFKHGVVGKRSQQQ